MKQYYIWSKKWTNCTDSLKTWWRPNCRGYTDNIEDAGIYTEEEINKHPEYFNNGIDSVAILIDDVKIIKAVRI